MARRVEVGEPTVVLTAKRGIDDILGAVKWQHFVLLKERPGGRELFYLIPAAASSFILAISLPFFAGCRLRVRPRAFGAA